MNKAVTAGLGILVVLAGSCVAQATDPDPKTKEIVFEDRPLRSWLEDQLTIDGWEKAEAALRRFCAKPEKAVPALTAALADKNETVRQAAALCLGYYLKEDAERLAIPPLLKALHEDKSSDVRKQAVAGLGSVGPKDKAVLAALVKALKEDKSYDVRVQVIQTVCDIKAASALPALIMATKDKDPNIRWAAYLALGEIGESKVVIPLLSEALTDVDLQECVGIALSQRCPAAIPALRLALQNKNHIVRDGAMFALRNTKEDVWPLLRKELPVLLPLLDDKDCIMRWSAANLLGQIKAVDAVPALAAKLGDEDSSVRFQCIQALGQIGPDAAVAVEKISERLKSDREPRLRSTAAEALGHIGPKAKAGVPALIEALQDKDKSVRLAAIDALGNIGPDAKVAVPKLMEAMDCDDKELIRRVEVGLKKIAAK